MPPIYATIDLNLGQRMYRFFSTSMYLITIIGIISRTLQGGSHPYIQVTLQSVELRWTIVV